jgi:hypothetical protein
MKSIALFALTIIIGFWAADSLCFDGEYSAKLWKQTNEYGAVWQRDAKHWFKQHGY